jgi:hypothetical protein
VSWDFKAHLPAVYKADVGVGDVIDHDAISSIFDLGES